MVPERIDVVAGATAVSLGVAPDGRLHQLSFGPTDALLPEGPLPFPIGLYPLAHATFGEEALREPVLRITHADGALTTRLVVREVAQEEAAPTGGGAVHTITLADRVAPVAVRLRYRTWPDHDVLETWVEVVDEGDATITLHEAAATAPSFAGSDATFTSWTGDWAAEWTEHTERIARGVRTVASAGGVRPTLTMPPLVLIAPDGPATETEGSVGACTLLWGGDCRFDVERGVLDQIRLIAGHQHRAADRLLGPGESFETPHALWTWSTSGIGATSRALHRFARDHLVRDGHRTRATVSNTWEAVAFSIDTPTLVEQVDLAADLGAELFLLDDGWFGAEFPRDDDEQGLGDWVVDPAKFPDGLGPTIEHTLARGLRFGLWVEPEMVNPRSALYREHPDWVIAAPDRERREARQQLVLDLCRRDVSDFVVDTVDRILAEHPGISYLKWDANRDVFDPWSSTLPASSQSHEPIDRVRATWAVMDEIARRHPDVELMLCASGGGRSELGTLRWFHEVWTSDNTDPVDRIRIQWGASHLLPASTIAAHVTRWGDRPIPFGCAVAMAGRFGFDLDLRRLSDEERAVCRRAVEDDHAIRDLVQHGDLHRLVSPLGSDRAALSYVDPAGERAVVFAWVFPPGADDPAARPARVELPEPLRGRSWQVVDRSPGRGADTPAPVLQHDALAWPDGPDGALVVELVPT